MTVNLNGNDWILISTYLDDKLSNHNKTKVEARLASDPAFKQALDEIAYTRRLLWSLPQKRAPRNFTLSPEKVKQPIPQPWLRPALSFVSIAASLLFVVLFAGTYIFGGSGALSKSMNQPAVAPEMAMSSGAETAEVTGTPYIINWDPQGSGGGTGNPLTDGYYGPQDGLGGAGGPGFGVGGGPAATEPPVGIEEPTSTEEPLTVIPRDSLSSEQPTDAGDMSTLILGIPDVETQGKIAATQPFSENPLRGPLTTRLIFLIVAGGTALIAGITAILLRRR